MAKLSPAFARRLNTPPMPTPRTNSPLPNTREVSSLAAEEVIEHFDDYDSPLAMESTFVDTTHTPRANTPHLPMPPKKTSTQSPVKVLPNGRDNFERPSVDPQTGEQIEYTPKTGKRKKTKQQRVHLVTDQDIAIFQAADWLGRSTVAHLAFAVGNTPKNIAGRLASLTRRGYLQASTAETMKLYGITKKGLDMLGSPEKPMAEPSRSTMAHRNKLNSTVIYFKIGGAAFGELLYKDSLDARKQVEVRNRTTSDYNAMLERDQARIRMIPELQRTQQEHSILKRHSRQAAALPEPIEPNTKQGFAEPQVALAERIILRDSAAVGEPYCAREWQTECDAFMNLEGFPTRRVGVDDSRAITDDERAFMESAVDGNSWIFKHWNPFSEFEKKHTPDGALVLPHRVHPDGSVTPGSYWIELEDQRKKLPEVVRACEQAMDAPNVRGLIYFTDDAAIANLVKRAKTEIIEKVLQLDTSGNSYEQKQARATAVVNDAILLAKPFSLNKHKNGSGYWG